MREESIIEQPTKEASPSTDEIISDIYEKRRNISIEEFIKLMELTSGKPDELAEKYPERTLFQYGSKVLILNIDREKKILSTMIKSIGENKEDKETTLLYQTAKRLMQEIADEEGVAFEYKIRTYNEKISQWAKKAGNDIFEWEEQKTVADALICKSTIKPKNLE